MQKKGEEPGKKKPSVQGEGVGTKGLRRTAYPGKKRRRLGRKTGPSAKGGEKKKLCDGGKTVLSELL